MICVSSEPLRKSRVEFVVENAGRLVQPDKRAVLGETPCELNLVEFVVGVRKLRIEIGNEDWDKRVEVGLIHHSAVAERHTHGGRSEHLLPK